MTSDRPLISVVDDDESVRESLSDLLKELRYAVQAFGSAEEFLGSDRLAKTKCVIVDISMPGMTGPELQLELTRRREGIRIVFITAQTDEAVRRSVMGCGAVDCLPKPFSETALLEAINAALHAA